ncbi:mercury(II) reductase [Parasedimentitalea psychrophila]|uniref:Mercuric reductase n=1 Tax=Parasedimentitalea psychrophila TaxID=2997337 RepID=A0A9Y2P768_9RHOB|nr:mercury(II) reductase [Parasedimentitalea psychrophila]WIY25728.1 mercury(II) reductase [Parasedimentitalea psychrophila]
MEGNSMNECCEDGSGSYDLIVIGAGSAGFSASITAANAGKRVALVGHGTIGGTCVNVGCVPSKAMIRVAEAVHGGASAARFPGITPCKHSVDWSAVVAAKDGLVDALRQKKYSDLLPSYQGIDYIEQGAAQLAEGGVQVGDRLIRAERIVVATGSHSMTPAIQGIEDVPVLDSTSLLELPEKPKSLIFIGGGYVGVELAQLMARLGVEVTLVTRSRLLPEAEPEVSQALADAFAAEGITVLDGLSYHAVSGNAGSVTLSIERRGEIVEITAEKLVVAAGRRANTKDMRLPEAGVTLDPRGAIVIGEDMQTSAPGIYAAGDVTNRDQFVYMAAYGAKLAAQNAVLEGTGRYENAAMPWVVFSDPQVAGVGLNEGAAKEAGFDVKTSIVPLDQVPRALAARDTRGLIKLVADRKTDRLLGGQIMAPEGSDSIQTLAMALKFGMTTKALGETLFPYLTTVEGLKLAAQTFDMDVAKLSCCAG